MADYYPLISRAVGALEKNNGENRRVIYDRARAALLAQLRGVTPLLIPECQDVEDLWSRSIEAARHAGLVEAGDRVVITAGTAVNIPGSTNVIKVDIA